MQAGAQRDAVNACVQRRIEPHLQRLARRVHGQLFHAVDEHHAVAALGLHGLADVQTRGLGQAAQVELHTALVRVVDVVLVELGLFLDEFGVETPVRHVLHHGVGNMAHAAQPCRLQRQLCGGNVHAHAADHEGDQLRAAEFQAEIVDSFHAYRGVCKFLPAAFAGAARAVPGRSNRVRGPQW